MSFASNDITALQGAIRPAEGFLGWLTRLRTSSCDSQ
jgi:hypothetical protein